jgi:hypothetical protein
VNLNHGCLVDAEHLVAIEVALFDTAVLQRDLAMKRHRDAKDDRALDLCLDSVRIDDNAAIDRTDDAPDTNPPAERERQKKPT